MKTSKLRVTGLCAANSPVTSEFPAQKANNAENVSIWWRHHDFFIMPYTHYSSEIMHMFPAFLCFLMDIQADLTGLFSVTTVIPWERY